MNNEERARPYVDNVLSDISRSHLREVTGCSDDIVFAHEHRILWADRVGRVTKSRHATYPYSDLVAKGKRLYASLIRPQTFHELEDLLPKVKSIRVFMRLANGPGGACGFLVVQASDVLDMMRGNDFQANSFRGDLSCTDNVLRIGMGT